MRHQQQTRVRVPSLKQKATCDSKQKRINNQRITTKIGKVSLAERNMTS